MMGASLRRYALLAACGLALLSCKSASSGCPGAPVTVRADFFGDVIGTGEVKVTPERFGSIQIEGSVLRGGAVIVKIDGRGACDEGAIGATFRGESVSQKGIKIEDGKLAAVFDPRPFGGRLVGAWDAVMVHKNGVSRPISGFFRDERPAPAPPAASASTATAK
jgi:hypothetical protein